MRSIKNNLKENYVLNFNNTPEHYLSCGGRFEVLGNHTDHNHGLCLAATVDLCITSAVSKRSDMFVEVVSKGYDKFIIDLSSLEIKENELSTSQGLIRGVAKYLFDQGYKIGGFNIYMESTIFEGAGVSSSAAFELLIGHVFNKLFNEEKIPTLTLAKAGQYSENNYFGKKSGLLDQIGVAFGGISYIDFENISSPIVDPIAIDFDIRYVIINTGGSHAHLSHLYSSIPQDMYNASHKLGVNFLRETSLEVLEAKKHLLSDIEYSRSKHYFTENIRVQKAFKAIKEKDLQTFFKMINESRISSTNDLKNMMVENEYEGSPLEACDIAVKAMEGHGAIKINGGGFAGSCIAFIENSHFDNFMKVMIDKYGEDKVKEVHVRKVGPSDIK